MWFYKRKLTLLLVAVIFSAVILSANATFEASTDYYFTVDAFNGELASEVLQSHQDRLAVATMLYSMAAYHIDEIHTSYVNPDPMTRVYLAELTSNKHFFRMYFFAPGKTWVFTCNTIFGQIVGGPMNSILVPDAAPLVMSTLQSEGTIGNYYPVDFNEIQQTIQALLGTSSPKASTARAYTPASLNQRMATRSGPGTQYTEELGIMPENTEIKLIEFVTTGVPWGLVEFYRNGVKVRAYTGMKRINAHGPVAQGTLDYYEVVLSRDTPVYYGPGYDFGQRKDTVRAGTTLRVFGSENGFIICDYKSGKEWVRAYFPEI